MSVVHSPTATGHETEHWTSRHLKVIIFIIVALAAFGIYLVFNIPIAVFPATNFPRIVVGVDNGVMPIDQMQVTITRPIEQAVNAVPGLERIISITSRGEAEIDLFFTWNVDMFQTLQYVNAAMASIQTTLPPTATVTVNRLTFAAFPDHGLQHDLGLDSANTPLGAGHVHHEASPESAARRVDHHRAGRPGTGVPDRARSGKADSITSHSPEPAGCLLEEQPHRLSRLSSSAIINSCSRW